MALSFCVKGMCFWLMTRNNSVATDLALFGFDLLLCFYLGGRPTCFVNVCFFSELFDICCLCFVVLFTHFFLFPAVEKSILMLIHFEVN